MTLTVAAQYKLWKISKEKNSWFSLCNQTINISYHYMYTYLQTITILQINPDTKIIDYRVKKDKI